MALCSVFFCVVVSSKTTFPRTKEVKISWYEVRTVHCVCGDTAHQNFMMASVVCTIMCDQALSRRSKNSDIFHVGWAWLRWAFKTSSFYITVDVQCFLPCKKFTWITPFSDQKNIAMTFPAESTHMNIFFLGISCNTITSVGACIQVQNVGLSFHPKWQFSIRSPHLLYHISANNQYQVHSLHFLKLPSFMTPTRTDLETGKQFINSHYTAFTNG
jgi:hypothetical protein